MEEMIHLLVIDKSTDSCETIIKIFREEGFPAEYLQVQTAESVTKALSSRHWDGIIIASQMLELTRLSISNISQSCLKSTPVILIGDKIGEDLAVKSMNEGASHCLEKNRLRCLVPIVKKALKHPQLNNQPAPQLNELNGIISAAQNCHNELYLVDAITLEYTYGNPKAIQSLGYTHQELYDLKLYQLYPDHTESSFRKLITPLFDGERSKMSVCIWQKRKNGSLYPVELHLQLTDHNASILSVSCSDLSNTKEKVEILNQQKKRADRYARINNQQAELMANVNHDLRTCLNSIILLSKNLASQNSSLNSKQLEHANTIYHSSTDLLELVDEVLDLSKIQSAGKDMRSESIELETICQKMEKIFSPIAREKNISFSYTIQDNSVKTIQTNRLCIDRILKNLLSNAFKFTKEGSVTITIYSPEDTEVEKSHINAERVVAFQVKDTGIGIPEEKQALIFQRFQQAEASTHESYGGSGLGLAICQDLTQQLGGTLQVQSTPGRGSLFTLYLPKEKPVQNHKSPKSSSHKAGTENKTEDYPSDGTVLLVDDCQMHNMALQEFLSYKIPNCISVNSAEETYQVIEQHLIDCLVLDMSLHDSDGYQIMTYLKTQKEYESIPVIIYTGKRLSTIEEERLNQYAHSIINKSVGSYKVLQNKILSILADNPSQASADSVAL